MKWNEVKKDHVFQDGSVVVQRHQEHLYDCYKLTYEDDTGQVKTLVASKDHYLKINIKRFPRKAKALIRKHCNGFIALAEDVYIEVLGYVTEEQDRLIRQYVVGEIDKTAFKQVEDLSGDYVEAYIFTFNDKTRKEVFVKRQTTKTEGQKIDRNHYWLSMEGIDYLLNTFGELSI